MIKSGVRNGLSGEILREHPQEVQTKKKMFLLFHILFCFFTTSLRIVWRPFLVLFDSFETLGFLGHLVERINVVFQETL